MCRGNKFTLTQFRGSSPDVHPWKCQPYFSSHSPSTQPKLTLRNTSGWSPYHFLFTTRCCALEISGRVKNGTTINCKQKALYVVLKQQLYLFEYCNCMILNEKVYHSIISLCIQYHKILPQCLHSVENRHNMIIYVDDLRENTLYKPSIYTGFGFQNK